LDSVIIGNVSGVWAGGIHGMHGIDWDD
jgi:hypothetical protein